MSRMPISWWIRIVQKRDDVSIQRARQVLAVLAEAVARRRCPATVLCSAHIELGKQALAKEFL